MAVQGFNIKTNLPAALIKLEITPQSFDALTLQTQPLILCSLASVGLEASADASEEVTQRYFCSPLFTTWIRPEGNQTSLQYVLLLASAMAISFFFLVFVQWLLSFLKNL